MDLALDSQWSAIEQRGHPYDVPGLVHSTLEHHTSAATPGPDENAPEVFDHTAPEVFDPIAPEVYNPSTPEVSNLPELSYSGQRAAATTSAYENGPEVFIPMPLANPGLQRAGTTGTYGNAPEAFNVRAMAYSDLQFAEPQDLSASSKEMGPDFVFEVISTDQDRGGAERTSQARKRRVWIGIAIASAIIIIGVVVGCVVGLVVRKPAGTEGGVSSCQDTVCAQILAVASQDSSLFVFARDQSKYIQYRRSTGFTWTSQWTTLPGGPFTSQPTAMSWNLDSLNVFTLAGGGSQTVLTLGYEDGRWNSTWLNMLESGASSVSLCVLENELNNANNASYGSSPARLDAMVVDSSTHQVVHDLWRGNLGYFDVPGDRKDWDASVGGLVSSSAPALVCRGNNANMVHNVLIYDTKRTLNHRKYLMGSGWQPWENWGGAFLKDPVVVKVGPDRFDFFGIGIDMAMYHLTWTSEGGASKLSLISPNGSFESVPSAVLTGLDPVRIDVVALGTDDSIKHRALVDSSWISDWEDLAIWGTSAPLVFNYQVMEGSPNVTGIVVIGTNNELKFTSWETNSSATSWKGLGGWTSAGGNWTTEYLEIS